MSDLSKPLKPLLVSSSPHIRSLQSVSKIMVYVILSLLPAVIFSIYQYGFYVLVMYYGNGDKTIWRATRRGDVRNSLYELLSSSYKPDDPTKNIWHRSDRMIAKRIRMFAVLTTVALLSGLVHAMVYAVSNPRIEENLADEQKKLIFSVLSETSRYIEKEEDGVKYFVGEDESGKATGIALPAEGNGYQGKINLMIGLTPDLSEITGLEVIQQVETPGLGGRIAENDFKGQFEGIRTNPAAYYVKNKEPDNNNTVQAITGATISSRAVVSIINEAVQRLKQVLKQGS